MQRWFVYDYYYISYYTLTIACNVFLPLSRERVNPWHRHGNLLVLSIWRPLVRLANLSLRSSQLEPRSSAAEALTHTGGAVTISISPQRYRLMQRSLGGWCTFTFMQDRLGR